MKITKDDLILALRAMIAAIEDDDSFEGRISYTCMDEYVPCERGEFEVDAFWRIGNSEGQGGSRMIQPSAPTIPVED